MESQRTRGERGGKKKRWSIATDDTDTISPDVSCVCVTSSACVQETKRRTSFGSVTGVFGYGCERRCVILSVADTGRYTNGLQVFVCIRDVVVGREARCVFWVVEKGMGLVRRIEGRANSKRNQTMLIPHLDYSLSSYFYCFVLHRPSNVNAVFWYELSTTSLSSPHASLAANMVDYIFNVFDSHITFYFN